MNAVANTTEIPKCLSGDDILGCSCHGLEMLGDISIIFTAQMALRSTQSYRLAWKPALATFTFFGIKAAILFSDSKAFRVYKSYYKPNFLNTGPALFAMAGGLLSRYIHKGSSTGKAVDVFLATLFSAGPLLMKMFA